MKTIFIITTLSLVLLSCGKSAICTDPPISVAFISFPLNDIDTLFLRKFSPNNNFQNLIDTNKIIAGVNSGIAASQDTSYINIYDRELNIKPGFDWQIFIPSTNRTFSISNITKEDLTTKCGTFTSGCFCENKILSINLNGQNSIPNSYQRNVLFIR